MCTPMFVYEFIDTFLHAQTPTHVHNYVYRHGCTRVCIYTRVCT